MDLYGDTTGAVWNPANYYYPLQFQLISEATSSYSSGDFDAAFSSFNSLFVLTAPFLDKDVREKIHQFVKEITQKIRDLQVGQRTKQKDDQIKRFKNENMIQVYEFLLELMDQIKKHGLLNWYSQKDTRSIAERNNK